MTMGPLIALVGVLNGTFHSETRFFRWQQLSRVLVGAEVGVEALLSLLGLVSVFVLPGTTLCLVTGFSTFWTGRLLLRVLAFMVVACFMSVLMMFILVTHFVTPHSTLDEAVETFNQIRFLNLVYVSFGVTFGGLSEFLSKVKLGESTTPGGTVSCSLLAFRLCSLSVSLSFCLFLSLPLSWIVS